MTPSVPTISPVAPPFSAVAVVMMNSFACSHSSLLTEGLSSTKKTTSKGTPHEFAPLLQSVPTLQRSPG